MGRNAPHFALPDVFTGQTVYLEDFEGHKALLIMFTPKGRAAVTTRYVAIDVKKGDQWQTSQLTETEASPSGAYSELRALEWLVGTWEDKAGDQTVETKIDWAGDKNFLTRTFKVKGADLNETDGWEVIGWDPERQEIRSWIFDSNGGFGEATWVNDGEHWLIQASNVLPDGGHSTAEHVLTRVDDNKFTWESQNRTLNGELQPSCLNLFDKALLLVRCKRTENINGSNR